MGHATPQHHNRAANESRRVRAVDAEMYLMMMAPRSRISGIVSELEHLLVNRQSLVLRLEALDPLEVKNIALARAEITTRLRRLTARQAALLDELAFLRPPASPPASRTCV